jgi:hypothetical protein
MVGDERSPDDGQGGESVSGAVEIALRAQIEESRRLLRDRDAFWLRVEKIEAALGRLVDEVERSDSRLKHTEAFEAARKLVNP